MPYLQLDNRKIPLPDGESTIGAVDGAVVRLPGQAAAPLAVISVAPLGWTIRRGVSDAEVRVNDVLLGREPLPLLHGDRIGIGASELRFGVDARAGRTIAVHADTLAEVLRVAPEDGRAVLSGGRLVSLVDGREYAIPAAGLTLGRAADTDVVLSSDDASRRHASIVADGLGYVLQDVSTNGCWVNGERVAGDRRLAHGDLLRLAGEEFRFSADVAAAEPAGGLATLEWLDAGPLQGTRFTLLSAVTHIGCDLTNDLAILDASLAGRQATLERRDDGWVLAAAPEVGTAVDGRPVDGLTALPAPAVLQLGAVRLAFTPIARAAAMALAVGVARLGV